MGTDCSPVGQIYLYTLHSTNPSYDLMELKSLEDWVARKAVQVRAERGRRRQLRRRHARIPGARRSGQAGRLRPEHRPGGAAAGRTTTSTRGGSFIEAGLQQINVRAVGLVDHVDDIENTVIKTQERHAAARQRHRRRRGRAEDPAGPDRQGDPSRGRQDRRQRRCGRRHRAAAQGRGLRRHARGHSREGGGAQRRRSCRRREDRSVSRPQRPGCITPPTPCCTT